jgi:hypothetical protein
MPEELCNPEHRAEDRDDVDDERAEDHAEDAVEDIRLQRFEPYFEA